MSQRLWIVCPTLQQRHSVVLDAIVAAAVIAAADRWEQPLSQRGSANQLGSSGAPGSRCFISAQSEDGKLLPKRLRWDKNGATVAWMKFAAAVASRSCFCETDHLGGGCTRRSGCVTDD